MHVELKDRHNCVMHGTGCCTWIYWQCTARYKDLLTVYSSVQRSIDSVLLGGKLHRQCTARYKDLSTVYCSVQCTGCTHRVPLGVKVIVEHRLAQVDLAC